MSNNSIDKDKIEEAVNKAQQGDTDSFADIYDAYVDMIYKYVFFKVDREEALDLTESIFLKVWENLKSYQVGKYYFSSWIFKIAHNMVVDHYKAKKENVSLEEIDLPDESDSNNPVKLTEKSISSEILKVAIPKLKKQYQQVILLKYIDDLENDVIAKIMKTSEGNLRILKFRALKELRKILDEMNVKY